MHGRKNIKLRNAEQGKLCIKVGWWNNSILWCTVEKISNYVMQNKENCALKSVEEIILYYDAQSKKYQIT